jgi:uncharacterized protein (TIGR02996 family)
MTPEDAFLQDIREHPDDDTPRLVYADWLEEHGDRTRAARAEFIRVQIALAGLDPDDERRPTLEARERQLRKKHERQWLGPLRQHLYDWQFRRGFLYHIAISAPALWNERAAVEEVVLVQSLHLRDVHDRRVMALLAEWPFLSQLHALDLSDNLFAAGVTAALVRSPHLSSLQTLCLNNNFLGVSEIHLLAELPELGGLTALELRHNNLTDAEADLLGSSPYLAGLRLLDLRGNHISEPAQVRLRGLFSRAVLRF